MKRSIGYWLFLLACVLLGVCIGLAAYAVPPDLPAIEFPVSTSSVVTVVGAPGVVILVGVAGVRIGFLLWQKLAARLSNSVGGGGAGEWSGFDDVDGNETKWMRGRCDECGRKTLTANGWCQRCHDASRD